ncbi:MAG: CDP-glycerol glycerophosphotransferase family protein, partial [Firmicutes bacterium]|nr:CDP-glycerol glycerophosphotransferase family protein [Bacillota bacterium]
KKIKNIISEINGSNGETARPADPSRIQTVLIGSTDYYKTIATCKYIACDATLKNFFIKREGQVYLNVWHGTPFKVMGRKVAGEPHMVGNAQKNFTIADYLLYPNDYMMDHMIEDYMIANTSKATIIMGGYPRNTAFFDKAKAAEIRKTQSIEDKRVFVYMPTYRHSLSGQALKDVLAEMDRNLNEDEIMFAKVHPLAADKVDYSDYSKIRKFPTEYETYEFLNTADCLITDYSSVFYDFAVTGKKIVLYTYDEEEYLETRGLYEPMSTLPFPQVKTVEETLAEARTEKNYEDSEFINKYCSYESPQATEVLCDVFINGPAAGLDGLAGKPIEFRQMPSNGRPNAIVYTDSLKPGKKTDDLLKFLEEV